MGGRKIGRSGAAEQALSPGGLMDRVPPQNIEAEMAVLGAMLLDNEVVADVFEQLNADSFYRDTHRTIFEAIAALLQENSPVDTITLTDQLRKQQALEAVGGPSYLTELVGSIPTAANTLHYARIVKEKSTLRQLITSATAIVSEAFSTESDVDVLLDRAERSIFAIAENRIRGGFVPLKELIKNSIEAIEQLYQRKTMVTGIPTGYQDLDEITAGFQKTDLIVLAGRPSMGKSALMCGFAEHIALAEKIPTAIFSLEMSKEQLVQRMLCSHSRVNMQSVRTGFLAQKDWANLVTTAGKMSQSPLFIDDTPGISVLELRAKARRLKAQYNIGFIILDYLQLMQAASPGVQSRQQEISDISRALKSLSRELGVPLLAVSQLSRATEQREGFRPRLSDLRDSGAIEQDADLVMLLFREEYYSPTDENKGRAEVIIAKQRNGPVGTKFLTFLKEFSRFESYAKREDEL